MDLTNNDSPASPLLIVCLCAHWCGVCRDYEPLARSTLAGFEADRVTLKWVDIEDHSELLGDLDVQNFPTLLIARGDTPLFWGTVTPHAHTLQRLVRHALARQLPAMSGNDDLRELVANVQAFQAPPPSCPGR